MWFKKKANISGFNPNSEPDGTDRRTNGQPILLTIPPHFLPVAEANKYFYLPALGLYDTGALTRIGTAGYYWSSSAWPLGSITGYSMHFGKSFVSMGYERYRGRGFRVGGFE